jgi:hypothetical protein
MTAVIRWVVDRKRVPLLVRCVKLEADVDVSDRLHGQQGSLL